MNRKASVCAMGMMITVLAACGPVAPTETPAIATASTVTEAAARFPLSEPGPYETGNRAYTFVDDSRDGREIRVTIWYPALVQPDAGGRIIRRDAMPDVSAAPYPMILTGPNSGDRLFLSHLASYGFVMAIVRYPDPIQLNWGFEMIDHPRDILFALDSIAANPPQGLEGMIDTERVGVAGYSSDGSYALALGGARIDPEFYLSRCGQAAATEPALWEWWCGPANNWEQFAAHGGEETTGGDEVLWQPLTDDRIRAVMPMAPNGAWLYGERGLAAVDRPVFLINGTEDEYVPYELEAAYIYQHLGTPERLLVSFIGKTHMMVLDEEPMAQMRHFAVAFFGYYLQGREEYVELFSEDFVSKFDDLAWGVYLDE